MDHRDTLDRLSPAGGGRGDVCHVHSSSSARVDNTILNVACADSCRSLKA